MTQAIAAGVGARITIALGNKLPLGLGTRQRGPFSCEATVRAIGDGRFRITGPIYTGETWAMGRTVVLTNDRPVPPVGVLQGRAHYPADDVLFGGLDLPLERVEELARAGEVEK